MWSGARGCVRGTLAALRRHPRRAACGAVLALAVGVGLYYGLGYLRAKAHLRSALEAMDRWEFERAMSDLDVCLSFWPDDGYTHALAARAARRAGAFGEAERHLRRCEALGYQNYTTSLESMLLLAQTGRIGQVEETLRLCVERDDLDSPLILEAMALGYILIYDVTRAGQCLELLLKRQPENGLALLWRGRVYAGINRFDLAEKDFRKAVELHPGYVDARLDLADRLRAQDMYAEAAEHYQKALAQRPGERRGLLGLARCRRQTGDTESARRLLDELLAAHPNDADALLQRGQVALDAQRPQEAESFLRRAVALKPNDHQVLFSLSVSLSQQGRAEAEEYRQRFERVKADERRLHKVLHDLSKRPDDPDLHDEAAVICMRNGQEPEALRWLKGALEKNPRHARTHTLLAEYFERIGNAEMAAQHRRLAVGEGQTGQRPPADPPRTAPAPAK